MLPHWGIISKDKCFISEIADIQICIVFINIIFVELVLAFALVNLININMCRSGFPIWLWLQYLLDSLLTYHTKASMPYISNCGHLDVEITTYTNVLLLIFYTSIYASNYFRAKKGSLTDHGRTVRRWLFDPSTHFYFKKLNNTVCRQTDTYTIYWILVCNRY